MPLSKPKFLVRALRLHQKIGSVLRRRKGTWFMFCCLNLVARQLPLPVQIVSFSTRTVSHLRVIGLGFLSDHTFMDDNNKNFSQKLYLGSLISTTHLVQKNLVRMFVACSENLQLPFRA